MYRALYEALGARLTAAGQLAEAREVFYLTETEVAAALTSSKTATDWQQLVRERQQEFAAYAHQVVPGRVTVPAPPFLAQTLEVPDATQPLRGTGCYAGQVRGEVLVVASPDDNLEVAGKIVCALRTDPGWATLFPACRGVIIERGSSLSHSVIVLRELGIPTIINVPGLTQRLQSGFRISMDGTTGIINLLAPENNDDSDHPD
jgi:pyruvate,water dikinase